MLAHDRLGQGEPLLLIHGIGHRRQGWSPVVERLAEHYEVITVDLPGHGESPAYSASGQHPREQLLADFRAFYAAAGLTRPHVVGNSLGGLIALELAKHDMAASVTALAPAGFWRNKVEFLYVKVLFRAVVLAARAMRPVAPWLLRSSLGRTLAFSWASAVPGGLDPEALVGDHANLLASRRTISAMLAGGYLYDASDVPVDLPVTIAWGTKDRVLLPYHAREARRRLPRARHVTLRGMGHVCMGDDPQLVADTILEAIPGGRPEQPGRLADHEVAAS